MLEYVQDHWRPGDTLYVHNGAQYAFVYYAECRCMHLSLWPIRIVTGQHEQFAQAAVPLTRSLVLGKYFGTAYDRYLTDLDRIRGRCNVWFLYSHANSAEEEDFIRTKLLPHLSGLGTRVAGIDEPGAHAYRYKLKGVGSCRR